MKAISRATAQAMAERRGARIEIEKPAPTEAQAPQQAISLPLAEAVVAAAEATTSAAELMAADQARALQDIRAAVEARSRKPWRFTVSYNPDGTISEVIATPLERTP